MDNGTKQTSRRELERFFAEVAPRLDTAATLDAELDRQLARRFNVFRYLRADEVGFSRMIADLLDPNGDHGQGTLFLKLLTDKLDFARGVNLRQAKVERERKIDRRSLDISVEIDDEHCLAIESKSNFAGDGESQVEDYLKSLKRYGNSLLLYLSPTGVGPTDASVGPQTVKELKTKTPRNFAIMPCDSSRAPSDDEFDELRLSFSLVDWLADCRRNCDVDRLHWYLREVETHCRQQYGGNLVTDSRKIAIEQFVREDSKNVATALAVFEAWPAVAWKIKEEFWGLIWNKLSDGMLGHDDWYWEGYFGPKRYESYIYAYRKSWRPYEVDGEKTFTQIRMDAQLPDGTGWIVGVRSPHASELSEVDQKRRKALDKELWELGKKQSPHWPCFDDQKYGDWDSLSPKLEAELREGGGEISTYFVDRFKRFAREATPIIDRIDGRRPRS